MRPDERPAFRRVLIGLAMIHRRDVTDTLEGQYWDALSDLALPQVETAVRELSRHGLKFPLPGEIRQFVPKAVSPKDCPYCGGTGWILRDCPGGTCERGERCRSPHRIARKCSCRG